jgi:phospholipase C
VMESEGGTHPGSLALLLWNIWLRPPPILDGQLERARQLPRALRGHDVVVLCEVFYEEAAQVLFEALAGEYPYRTPILGEVGRGRRIGLDGPAVAEERTGWRVRTKRWNGGVVILSRHPLDSVASRSFDGHLGPPDLFANKGVLYARLLKEGRPYHVLGTHCQAAPEPAVRLGYRLIGRDAEKEFEQHRMAGFDIVRRFIEELALPADELVLIAGDLNTDRIGAPRQFDEMLSRLDAVFPSPAPGSATATFDPTRNRLASGGAGQWIDYVLWSRSHLAPAAARIEALPHLAQGEWRRHRLGRKQETLSDHYPVLGSLSFAERRG